MSQEADFYVSTRANQYILKGLSRDRDTGYNIISGYDDEGYDFYIAFSLDEWTTNNLDKELGVEDAKRFEKIVVPEGLYLICETERTKYPTMLFEDLRKKWLVSGFLLRATNWPMHRKYRYIIGSFITEMKK